jgi:hypothetical protein
MRGWERACLAPLPLSRSRPNSSTRITSITWHRKSFTTQAHGESLVKNLRLVRVSVVKNGFLELSTEI